MSQIPYELGTYYPLFTKSLNHGYDSSLHHPAAEAELGLGSGGSHPHDLPIASSLSVTKRKGAQGPETAKSPLQLNEFELGCPREGTMCCKSPLTAFPASLPPASCLFPPHC